MLNDNTFLEGGKFDVRGEFERSRQQTVDLIQGFTPEDCQAQSMEDASPAKWHLAHTTWFYEMMILKPFEEGFKAWNDEYAVLFNSYYNGIGDKHPRAKRGLITRPTLAEVLDWRKNINERIVTLYEKKSHPQLSWLIQLGINHEQQHQELLLTDMHHLLSQNSLLSMRVAEAKGDTGKAKTFEWVEGNAGSSQFGVMEDGFHFDNEAPNHAVFLQPHMMGNRLVTNREWLQFIEDGGYQDFRWWLDEGWTWLQATRVAQPLYWDRLEQGVFARFTINGLRTLELDVPVANVSYFEADAFSRWASSNIPEYQGARLPTEFEWEAFAQTHQLTVDDLFGHVWQWTSSSYAPYPGYRPWGGVAGEYNGKFMVNQMVLRGSSAYTPRGHSRVTYRNFFPTHARWQLSGLRLARDSH